MKGLTTTIAEKNPYEHNGESLHISPHTESSLSIKDEVVTKSKKFYIESYGCQMNFADSEIVASILNEDGYKITEILEEASLVLVNTCAIREKAELTVRKRLEYFNSLKIKKSEMTLGVLGCMA